MPDLPIDLPCGCKIAGGARFLCAQHTEAVEFPVMRVMAIRRDSPAWKVLTEAIPIKPGQLIPVTQDELDSLREDCLILDVLPDSAEAKHGE